MSSIKAKELEALRGLIGNTCSIMASSVVRLYIARPHAEQWEYADVCGALLFVKDRKLDTYFFMIFDLSETPFPLRYEYELYENMAYNESRPFLHTFEMEDCVAAFNFCDEAEAKRFRARVLSLQPGSGPNSLRGSGSARLSGGINGAQSRMSGGRGGDSPEKKRSSNSSNFFSRMFGGGSSSSSSSSSAAGQEISVGEVISVTHTAHVGFNADGSFDVKNIPPEWKLMFKAAGVRKRDLQDPEMLPEIMKIVNEAQGTDISATPAPAAAATGGPGARGGRGAPPPPVPRPRKESRASRRAAPPPPVRAITGASEALPSSYAAQLAESRAREAEIERQREEAHKKREEEEKKKRQAELEKIKRERDEAELERRARGERDRLRAEAAEKEDALRKAREEFERQRQELEAQREELARQQRVFEEERRAADQARAAVMAGGASAARAGTAPPPPPSVGTLPSPPRAAGSGPPVPPPMGGLAGKTSPPPPPPMPMPSGSATATAGAGAAAAGGGGGGGGGGGRGGLLASIQGFKKGGLKSAGERKLPPPPPGVASGGGGRPGGFLGDIKNFKRGNLKKAEERKMGPPPGLKKLSGAQQVTLIDKLRDKMKMLRKDVGEEDDDGGDSDWSD